jgi:hypothetical protein
MTVDTLYPIIMELTFGKFTDMYLILESCSARKEVGLLMARLLHECGFNRSESTTYMWTVIINGNTKHIYYVLPIQRRHLDYTNTSNLIIYIDE